MEQLQVHRMKGVDSDISTDCYGPHKLALMRSHSTLRGRKSRPQSAIKSAGVTLSAPQWLSDYGRSKEGERSWAVTQLALEAINGY